MAEVRDAHGLTVTATAYKRTRPPLRARFITGLRANLFAHVERADTGQTCVISIAGLSETPLSRFACRGLTGVWFNVGGADIRLAGIRLIEIGFGNIQNR
tara:strand:- start:191 stop:490 length:300 start_codon:yes stop_codon:yes gene_type:complete